MRPHRTPFILLSVAVLGSGLVGLLLLNTTLAQGSFQVYDLQRRTAALEEREQKLQIAVDDAGTPNNLVKAARQLGLVPAKDPGFLRLRDGRVLGNPRPATSPLPVVAAGPVDDPTAAEGDAAAASGDKETKKNGKAATDGETPSEQDPDRRDRTAADRDVERERDGRGRT
jgi:hypothetical protein